MKISFILNGKKATLETPPAKRLLDILREDFGLFGSKKGCEQGECGACVVFINDTLVNSCLIPAFRLDGKAVMTIEGFVNQKEYAVIEEAFQNSNITLCGFCAPGIVLTIADLLSRMQFPNKKEIKEALSGSICRCHGYHAVIGVVLSAFEIRNRKKNAKRG